MHSLDLKKLLRQMPKASVSKKLQSESKFRVMSYINNEIESPMIVRLLEKLPKPRVSLYMRQLVRERILTFIKRKTIWEQLHEGLGAIIIKGAIVPTLIASIFFVNIIGVNTTSAEIESRAILIKGTAKIRHLGGDWEDINNYEVLSIGDKIRTSNDSLVEIYYYDNSVSRIAENSSISISSLSTDIYKTLPTVVKVENGRLWNQVVSSEHKFQVETDDAFVTTKNGAFDVKKNGTTEIAAITQPIDVKIIKEKKLSYSTRLGAGYGMKSSSNETKKVINDKWRQENVIADISYKKSLLDNLVDKALGEVKILPDNKLYFAKKTFEELINESTVSMIKKRLQELKILTLNNSLVDLISANKNVINKLMVSLTEDEKLALIEFLDTELSKIELVLPSHNLYSYKIYLSDLLVGLDEKGDYKKQIAISRLNEAQDIATLGDSSNKKDLIVALNYFNGVSDYGTGDITGTGNAKNDLKSYLNDKNDQLFLIQSIENSLKVSDSNDIKKAVQQEKQEIASDIKEVMQELYGNSAIGNSLNSPGGTKDFSEKIALIVDKINKYQSKKGKINTLYWAIEDMPNSQRSLTILYALREKFEEPELKVVISRKIAKIGVSNK